MLIGSYGSKIEALRKELLLKKKELEAERKEENELLDITVASLVSVVYNGESI